MAIEDDAEAHAYRSPLDARAFAAQPPGRLSARSLSVLMGIAWALQMLDALSFLHLMAVRGPAAELNPLMRSLYLVGGPVAIIGVKAAVAGPIVLLLSRMGLWGDRRIARAGLIAIAALGLFECLSNMPAPL